MSGRKQHFIPQVLLKGFAAEETRKTKTVRVWVFPNSGAPFCSATEGVAAQRHFYSGPSNDGGATLDDTITAYEGRFSTLLRQVRHALNDDPVDGAIAREIVSHLVMRNAHLRHGFERAVGGIVDAVIETFRDEKRLRVLLGLNELLPNAKFREYFEKNFDSLPVQLTGSLPRELVEYLSFVAAKENLPIVIDGHVEILAAALSTFSGSLGSQTRAGHNRILEQVPLPTGLIDATRIDSWKVVDSTVSLILPDCVAVALDEDENARPLLFSDTERVDGLFLPISAKRALVGYCSDKSPPQAALFNQYAATCSQQFFVASERTDAINGLHATIGRDAHAAIDQMLDRTVSRLIPESVDPMFVEPAGFVPRSVSNSPPQPLGGVEARFVDFSANAPIKEIAEEIGLVIGELQDLWPLERLDGISFAHDYERALLELDRGFEPTGPLETIAPEYGRGLFRTPLVLRDGHPKVRLVGRAEMAYGLIAADEADRTFSTYALVRALAQVAYSGLVETAIPGFLLGRHVDFLEGGRLEAINSALNSYFSSRYSAPLNPGILDSQIELLENTIEVAAERVVGDIRAHWTSPDFGGVARSALYHGSLVLDRTAEVAGSMHALSSCVTDYPQLDARLQACGLSNWFEMFSSDLERWWGRQGNWSGVGEFSALAVHVDRMMWAFSVLLWKKPDGEWQVFAPLGPVTAQG